jgi:uracil-DNA glycosylase
MASYDPGPNSAWRTLFDAAPFNHYATYPLKPFHTRFGPVFYRGRLDGSARVLVIGQDPSTDEVLAQRILVGQAGQIAQNFLSRLGLTRSYLMFNTFLFGGQSGKLKPAMATDATVMAYRNSLFDKAKATNALEAVIAFGAHAQASAASWPGLGGLTVIPLKHPTAQGGGVAADWNANFAAAHAAIAPDADGHVDATPYDTTAAMPTTDIPRRDLPFGLPAWHGTKGATRSKRGTSFETQILWTAP